MDDKKQRITNLALDRIVSLETAKDTKFIPNKTIDFDHYFDDVVGVTVPQGAELTDICLHFSASRFKYVTSKPIHQSQKTVNEEECILSIKVKPNPELEQQILSFGPDVEVLSPEWLRNEIKTKIEKAVKQYEP